MDKSRPYCKCGKLVAINYHKNNKVYYRKKCHGCLQKDKVPQEEWKLLGYIKKDYCEKCGFKARHSEQIKVIQTKCSLRSYKSVCLNCNVDLSLSGGWSAGDLEADY